jgi:hypothetical protein
VVCGLELRGSGEMPTFVRARSLVCGAEEITECTCFLDDGTKMAMLQGHGIVPLPPGQWERKKRL